MADLTGTLRQSGQVTLDANGNGTIYFTPMNAHQRWEVDGVTAWTSAAITQTPVPSVTVYLGGVPTPLGNQGSIYASSNTFANFSGSLDVSPVETLSVVFSNGIPGTTGYANISGTYYTRRG